MARLLLALTVALALATPLAAVDEQDIVPERLSLRRFKLLSWDPQTGILYGTIDGEPAGSGNVTAQILAATRVRRASLRNTLPNSPMRTDLEAWNAAWAAIPPVPIKTFGEPAAPVNPMSPILASMVTNGGYVKLRLNKDLSTVRAIKPYYPPTPI